MIPDNNIFSANGHDYQERSRIINHCEELVDELDYEPVKSYDNVSDADLRSLETTLVEALQERNLNAAHGSAPTETTKQFQRVMFQTWEAMKETKFNPTVRLTFLALLKYCWSKDRCSLFQKTLANEVGCTIKTIQRSITTLANADWITTEETRHRDKLTYIILRRDLLPPYPKRR